VEREQVERMRAMRSTRDNDRCRRGLDALIEAARTNQNVIPAMLDCARAYCTLFEIRDALEGVYGAYREPIFF
jgi:methylmalonyl-CoA mutase N-terminal domain/subunit